LRAGSLSPSSREGSEARKHRPSGCPAISTGRCSWSAGRGARANAAPSAKPGHPTTRSQSPPYSLTAFQRQVPSLPSRRNTRTGATRSTTVRTPNSRARRPTVMNAA
jgi:hypothetical protein